MAASGSIFRVSPIDAELFFTINDEDLLRQIHGQFSGQLDRLERAYSISDDGIPNPSTKSPSQLLYGAQYHEVNRTLVSILSLRWIQNNQYKTFTGTQPALEKLTQPSFDWIRQIFSKSLKTSMDLYALLIYSIIHDLGKDPWLASDYYLQTGDPIFTENHDIILQRAASHGLIPCIDSLPPMYKSDIIQSMQLGAELNIGQLAQAECPVISLSGLRNIKGHDRAFEFGFMHQLLDIAGAAGHEDWSCARKLIQPIFESYKLVYNAALRIITGEKGLRECYDTILEWRAEMLHEKGFRSLNIRNNDDRALLRLLCMGSVDNLETAQLYDFVWENLDKDTRRVLTYSLNVDGSVADAAVQPTYMPAMLTQGIDATHYSSGNRKAQNLRSMLRYLARVMTLTDQLRDQALVIERSVLWVVKDIVQSATFRDDPTVLESTDIPESVLLKLT